MNRITIDLDALEYNLNVISNWVEGHGATLTVVTKALCGHRETLEALRDLGVDSMSDSRLDNLEVVRDVAPDVETWYLRPPHSSALDDVVRLANVSLNTELEIIQELNDEARKQETVHRVVVMIELGDLREGILPGRLLQTYKNIFELPNIRVIGIGANLGCLGGVVPSIDQFMQLALYRELLELKFERKLPLISAGSSSSLPLLIDGSLPRQINHFRVGESVFLGTNLIQGGFLEGLRSDAMRLEAEIVEIKEKGMVPLGETTEMTPFQPLEENEETDPGQRGYRAIVTVGQVDTDIGGLTPVNESYKIAGASSDLTVVNVGEVKEGLTVGDRIGFRAAYSSFVRLMANPYTEKVLLRPAS
ncbi:MAG: alanine/ornithine racemase family PLP-dependent enzyme [Candidatus Eisenbacteria bacterium]|nr:alanine/ornithine racemase family PLP-dependent enzyme [Candidatus Eisenbacteria bacterium]